MAGNCEWHPEFWSSIEYSLCYGTRGEEHELTLALERSKEFPLDASFTLIGNKTPTWFRPGVEVAFGDSHHPGQYFATHLAALMSHAHRIRTLTIRTQRQDLLYQILNAFLDVSTPLLERIVIDASPSYDIFRSLQWPFVFLRGGAPTLKSLELKDITILHCRPPLKNVTHLILFQYKRLTRPMDIVEFRNVLAVFTSLESLSPHGTIFVANPENAPTITIPTLRSLDAIYCNGVVDMTHFYLPVLETLHSDHPIEIRAPFLHPRFPNVRTLCLRHVTENHSHFPQVTDISILFVDAASRVLGDMGCWPLLRNLTVMFGDSEALGGVMSDHIATGYPIITLSLQKRTVSDPLRKGCAQTNWYSNYKSYPSDPYTLHWQGTHGQYGLHIVTV